VSEGDKGLYVDIHPRTNLRIQIGLLDIDTVVLEVCHYRNAVTHSIHQDGVALSDYLTGLFSRLDDVDALESNRRRSKILQTIIPGRTNEAGFTKVLLEEIKACGFADATTSTEGG
jgi:hypothetical protein